jgi:two-component system LytT family response regulator
MKQAISVAVIESDKIKIDFIKHTLNNFGERILVTKFEDSVEKGIKAIEKFHPDVVFLDISMKDANGNTLLDRFDKFSFDIIILDNFDFYRLEAKDNQKVGFIFKLLDISDLI